MDERHDLMEIRCQVPVRPNDFDWSRQLNNAVYPQLLEIGRWTWTLENDIDLRQSSLVGVVSRIELDYLKPVMWDPMAALTVRTSVRDIERFSIYLNQTIEDMDRKVCAKALVRLAMYDTDKKTLVAIDFARLRRKHA